jgi:cytochrome c
MKPAARWAAIASGVAWIAMAPGIAPAATPAATPAAIATGAGCAACHLVDKKKLGPSYRDIAARYKGNPRAPADLAAKVRSGGKGVWGVIPMPASDAKKISAADLDAVIGWILKQQG